jgi:hypothetical protein
VQWGFRTAVFVLRTFLWPCCLDITRNVLCTQQIVLCTRVLYCTVSLCICLRHLKNVSNWRPRNSLPIKPNFFPPFLSRPFLPTHSRYRRLLLHRSHCMTRARGRIRLEGGSARRRYNTRYSQQTDFHAPSGFEPAIPASERPHTYVLDLAATEVGWDYISVRFA